MRALAVIAVVVFHSALGIAPGGFLGVEVFFVISGYIITRALLAEREEHGRIALGSFWLRRARRLLPALFLLLFAVAAYTVVFEPGEAAGLRRDILAALAYVTNWDLIVAGETYFDSWERPSLLRHTSGRWRWRSSSTWSGPSLWRGAWRSCGTGSRWRSSSAGRPPRRSRWRRSTSPAAPSRASTTARTRARPGS